MIWFYTNHPSQVMQHSCVLVMTYLYTYSITHSSHYEQHCSQYLILKLPNLEKQILLQNTKKHSLKDMLRLIFLFLCDFGTSFRIKHDQVKWSQLNQPIHGSKEIRVWLIFPCFWHIYLYILLTLALSCMMFHYVNWNLTHQLLNFYVLQRHALRNVGEITLQD